MLKTGGFQDVDFNKQSCDIIHIKLVLEIKEKNCGGSMAYKIGEVAKLWEFLLKPSVIMSGKA